MSPLGKADVKIVVQGDQSVVIDPLADVDWLVLSLTTKDADRMSDHRRGPLAPLDRGRVVQQAACKARQIAYLRQVTAAQRTDLEEARLQLSEGLLRLWEQADLIDKLFREGKSTEAARDLLVSMQQTLDKLRLHIDFLIATAIRPD
jgi:hypothetical protein